MDVDTTERVWIDCGSFTGLQDSEFCFVDCIIIMAHGIRHSLLQRRWAYSVSVAHGYMRSSIAINIKNRRLETLESDQDALQALLCVVINAPWVIIAW